VLVALYTEHMFGWEAYGLGIFKSLGGVLNIGPGPPARPGWLSALRVFHSIK
jgi:hypothetical protein